MNNKDGASALTGTGLSPSVEPASGLAGFAASIPDADLLDDLTAEQSERPSCALDWIVLGVDRKGEAYVMDADRDFFAVDLLPEFWACDNGIEYPAGLATGLYLMTDVVIRTDSYGDPTFKGKIEPIALAAQAIEARSGETGTGSIRQDESAVRQDAPNTAAELARTKSEAGE